MRARRPWSAFLGAFWPFIVGVTLIAAGLVAIVIGYLGVSGTVFVGLQVPYLVSGAVLGLALVFLGSVLLLVQVMTRQTRLLRRLLAEVESPAAGDIAAPAALPDDGAASPNGAKVYAVRGGRWFHRPGCILLEGKRATPMSPHQADLEHLTPCRLCDPTVPAAT